MNNIQFQIPQAGLCRYYLDTAYLESADAKRPILKQALAAEELLKEAEEQADIDEVHAKSLYKMTGQAAPIETDFTGI